MVRHSQFCHDCRVTNLSLQLPPQTLYIQYVPRPSNGMAIAGFILGLGAALLGLIPIMGAFLFWVPALLGIIFGFIGIANSARVEGLHRGLAVWGVVLGFASGPLSLLAFLFLTALINSASNSVSGYYS